MKKGFLRRCASQKVLISMVIPGIVLVFLFSYLPMYAVLIAFQKYNPVKGVWGGEWVGLKYFKMFLANPFMGRLLKNTLLLGIFAFLWSFPAPIILALLLDQISNSKFKRVVQTISYLPYFLSAVVLIGIVQEFFSIGGIVNSIRMSMGLEEIAYMAKPQYFRSLYIGSGIWQGIGWGSIIYLAALSNVDTQLYEAALIDGANRWQRVRYVAWPTILPTITIQIIFSVSGILGSDFQKIILMYSETTYEVADVINTYVYREGILGGRFEYTTAVGLMMNLVSFVLLFAANKISGKLSETSLW